jgi:probable phosphoglycerate mutase
LQNIHFDVIYTSPSQRAKKIAEILHEQRECELLCHDDLREIYMGDWEGRLRKEVQLQLPDAYAAFWETPHLYVPENGGESYYDLQKRAIGFVNSLLLQHEGETVLLVTHAATLKILLSYFENRYWTNSGSHHLFILRHFVR